MSTGSPPGAPASMSLRIAWPRASLPTDRSLLGAEGLDQCLYSAVGQPRRTASKWNAGKNQPSSVFVRHLLNQVEQFAARSGTRSILLSEPPCPRTYHCHLEWCRPSIARRCCESDLANFRDRCNSPFPTCVEIPPPLHRSDRGRSAMSRRVPSPGHLLQLARCRSCSRSGTVDAVARCPNSIGSSSHNARTASWDWPQYYAGHINRHSCRLNEPVARNQP